MFSGFRLFPEALDEFLYSRELLRFELALFERTSQEIELVRLGFCSIYLLCR